MLYGEFLTGTSLPDQESSFLLYKIFENIYMNTEASHADIYHQARLCAEMLRKNDIVLTAERSIK